MNDPHQLSDLPRSVMYALRHGTTGRIWTPCGPDGFWLFKSPQSLERTWENLKKVGIVSSEFYEHMVVKIFLSVEE